MSRKNLYNKIVSPGLNQMNRASIGKSKRLASMLIDNTILSFLLVPPLSIFLRTTDNQLNEGIQNDKIIAIALFMIVYMLKDSFRGRSAAKRILNLQIVDIKTGKSANIIQCFTRNLTTPLWMIEVIVAWINPERRIGDYLAGTRTTLFEKPTI